MTVGKEHLRAAHASKNWDLLWRAALPIAAAALRRLVRQGRLGAFDEDLAQTVYLAMHNVVRRWDPELAGFTTCVTRWAEGAVLMAQERHRRLGFTGVPDGERPTVVSLDQPLRENEDAVSLHEVVAYPDPPQGVRPPDQELETEQRAAAVRAAIAGLTDTEKAILRQAFGGEPVAPERTARWRNTRTVRRLKQEVMDG